MKKLLLVPSIIILAAVVIYSNPAEIAGRIAGSNVLYIFLALLVSLLSLMLRALKWNVLLKKAKYRDVLCRERTAASSSPRRSATPLRARPAAALQPLRRAPPQRATRAGAPV